MDEWKFKEVYVSPRLHSVYERLKYLELNHSKFQNEDMKKHVKEWSNSLLGVANVVEEIEDKQQQLKPDYSCKMWLTRLEEVLYDLDNKVDLLEILIRSHQKQQQNDNDGNIYESIFSSSIISHLNKLASEHPFQQQRLVQVMGNHFIQEGNVCRDGANLVIEGPQIVINNHEGSQTRNFHKWKRPDSISSPFIPVYGREEEVENIINSFEKDTDAFHSVTCIIGPGGIGKTTLAQQIYNHDKVKNLFDVKAWVCVTQDWVDLLITTSIYNSVNDSDTKFRNIDEAHRKLRKLLDSKKYFIVLDDVWITHYNDWLLLSSVLSVGANGSKILVTTRNRNTAQLLHTCQHCHHELGNLDNDMIWKIYQHASAVTLAEGSVRKSFKETILEKCKGLPLAALVLGGIRRKLRDDSKLERKLNSEHWAVEDDETGIRPLLKMSFDYLRRELKPCFAYCSIVKKGIEFEKQKIIQMWIGEGLLLAKHGKEMEEVGEDYFDELVSALLIQPLKFSDLRFTMHDLIIDLAQSVAGDAYCRVEDSRPISERTHHLHLSSRYQIEFFNKFQNIGKATHLRTFSCVPNISIFLPQIFFYEWIAKLRNVRVLCLRVQIQELPNTIGELTHLRLLDLSRSLIRHLPKSISNLVNLQTLLFQYSNLHELPKELWDLVNLRHIDVSGCTRLKKIAPGFRKLIELQTLTMIIVGGNDGCNIQDIKELKKLSGEISIKLNDTSDITSKHGLVLSDKSSLQSIELHFPNDGTGENHEQVLNVLQPHENLSRLTLVQYGGEKFPPWNFCNFQCLTEVKLSGQRCTYLPPLGSLPTLKVLILSEFRLLEEVNYEFYGRDGFPALESLKFFGIDRLTKFHNPSSNNKAYFPKLQELKISCCSELCEISPGKLPCLRKLLVMSCRKSKVSLGNWPLLRELSILGCKAIISTENVLYYQLRTVNLVSVQELEFLNEIMPLQGLKNLQRLLIEKCYQLRYLWSCNTMKMGQPSLCSLHDFSIKSCPNLGCLSLYNLKNDLPPSARVCLNINGEFPNYRYDLSPYFSLQTLEALELEHLDYVHTISELPRNLRYLIISHCVLSSITVMLPKLTFLKMEDCDELQAVRFNSHSNMNLQHVKIGNCKRLKYFGGISITIEQLSLHECPLKCFKSQNIQAQSASFSTLSFGSQLPTWCYSNRLTSLSIDGCQGLCLFADDGLPSSLIKLEIYRGKDLKALPNRMYQLTSLQELYVRYCTEVRSFPEGGFPPNLRLLCINGVNIQTPLNEWHLEDIHNLETLELKDVSFSHESQVLHLPPSLKTLTLVAIPNLEIHECPNLTLPDQGGNECWAPLLEYLRVLTCPKLEQQCRRSPFRERIMRISHVFPNTLVGPTLLEMNTILGNSSVRYTDEIYFREYQQPKKAKKQ